MSQKQSLKSDGPRWRLDFLDPVLPPNFDLLDFATLIELTMTVEQMNQDETIAFLEQH